MVTDPRGRASALASPGIGAWCGVPKFPWVQGASPCPRWLYTIAQHHTAAACSYANSGILDLVLRAVWRSASHARWAWLAQILPKSSWTSIPSRNPRRQERRVLGQPDLEAISGSSPANAMTTMRPQAVSRLSGSINPCFFCLSSASCLRARSWELWAILRVSSVIGSPHGR